MSLSVGVTYTFQIIATNAIGTALIGTTTGVIPFSAPGAPGTGLATAGTAAQTAVITFRQGLTNANPISQYNYSTTGTGGPWTAVTSIGTSAGPGANTTVTTSVGTLAYGTYTFNLQAQNTAGTGLPGTNTYGPIILNKSAYVSTFAGQTTAGTNKGKGTNAQFDMPIDLVVKQTTGVIYVTEFGNYCISAIGTDGNVTKLITTQGQSPFIAIDQKTGVIYYAINNLNNIKIIYKVGTDNNQSMFAGQTGTGYVDAKGTNAKFNNISGLAVNDSGIVYVSDRDNNRIRMIGTDSTVTTFAGQTGTGYVDAKGTNAKFYSPYKLAVGSNGVVYVTDLGNNCIRAIDTNGNVTTLAGQTTAGTNDGKGTNATFKFLNSITVNNETGILYISERHRIRMIGTDASVTSLAGRGTANGFADNAIGTNVLFNNLYGVAVNDKTDIIYVADMTNNRIRMIQ